MVLMDSDLELYGGMRKKIKKLTQSRYPSSPSCLETDIIGGFLQPQLLGS